MLMECYCVASKTQIGMKKLNRTVIVCGFEVCSHVLNFMVIGQYTITLSESNQGCAVP